MSRPNWYKKAPRRYRPFSKIFRRRRKWSDAGRWLVIMAVLLTFAEYFTVGAVTWPDTVMRTGHGVVKSAVAALPIGDGEPSSEVPEKAVEYRVSRIVDGDTVYMRDGTKVRLHGIDTPERDQPYGKQATRALSKLIQTKVFALEKDTDRYGRLVAVLFTPEGVNVNIEMVCGGHAWWYEQYARFDSDLEDCQKSAQEAKRGLWAYDDSVEPWEWRKK